MSIFKYLMLPGARRRMERRERRHAFRDAENAIAEVKARQAELEQEAKKQWDSARTALKNGEKAGQRPEVEGVRDAFLDELAGFEVPAAETAEAPAVAVPETAAQAQRTAPTAEPLDLSGF